MTLVRREKRGSLVQRQAGDEEVHGCQRSSLPAQARVHCGIRIRKPLIWQHDGEVPAERQDATALLEWIDAAVFASYTYVNGGDGTYALEPVGDCVV